MEKSPPSSSWLISPFRVSNNLLVVIHFEMAYSFQIKIPQDSRCRGIFLGLTIEAALLLFVFLDLFKIRIDNIFFRGGAAGLVATSPGIGPGIGSGLLIVG